MTRRLVDQCLAVSWSQWVALGVSGTGAISKATHAVDLEAAIAFAPTIEYLDPRLYSEVLDWCIHFANDFVSVASLRHALAAFDEEHRATFQLFAALVNEHGGAKWPSAPSPSHRSFRPSGKSRVRLDHAAAVQLRARKIFGINARADILVGLALLPSTKEPRWTHVSLLRDLGYSKRALSGALNDLAAGGLLGTLQFGNTVRYSLRRREPLRELLAPLPETPGQAWSQRLALAAALVSLQKRLAGKSATTQAIELHKLFERKQIILERAQVGVPTISHTDPWHDIEAWLEPLLNP